MTEVLFILTTIYVAYVVYTIFNENKTNYKLSSSDTKLQVSAAVVEQSEPETASLQETSVPVEQKATAVPTANPGKGTVRDPKTGEVASVSGNYRFAKRWIKEALVTEGLLEKVYKNNELDSAAETLIKDALGKLEAMDKYRA